MTYYEKLVKKINQSMEKHPHSAMVMDMGTLQVIGKGANLASAHKKMSGKTHGNLLVFQKPNEKAAWVL